MIKRVQWDVITLEYTLKRFRYLSIASCFYVILVTALCRVPETLLLFQNRNNLLLALLCVKPYHLVYANRCYDLSYNKLHTYKLWKRKAVLTVTSVMTGFPRVPKGSNKSYISYEIYFLKTSLFFLRSWNKSTIHLSVFKFVGDALITVCNLEMTDWI